MKKIICFIVVFMAFKQHIYCKDLVVNFVVDNVNYGSMTLTELEDVLDYSQYTKDMIKAEEAGRVEAHTTPDKFKVLEDSTVIAETTIKWFDESGKVIKSITVELTFDMSQINKKSSIREFYTKLAEWGLPPALIIIVILLLLV